MSGEDGYGRYRAYFDRPPLLTLEWRDPGSPAVGVLVINSLAGGAAGGGTRMRSFAPAGGLGDPDVAAMRHEALFLAKTMEIKFRVCGPPIGGAKSVLHFDPADPRKRGVLARWFQAIGPYLRHCYGTGGDLNVDEVSEVIPLIQEGLGLAHPQQGVVAGHFGSASAGIESRLERLRTGGGLPVDLPDVLPAELRVADLVTGFGVAAATAAYYDLAGSGLAGRRVLVEGFGSVGGSAAYDLHRRGARVVGIVARDGAELCWATDPAGLDVPALLAARRGATLPASCPRGESAEPFWDLAADCFVPAARSHGIGAATLDRLLSRGVSVIACGANNPFDDPPFGDLAVQRRADAELAVLPDFIVNCGAARAFHYLMRDDAELIPEAIFADVEATIGAAMARLLAAGSADRGLTERALALFVPAT